MQKHSTAAHYLSLIKFSHTIFALPFALIGYFLGVYDSGASFSGPLFILVILCMIFARSAAMAFNRYLDREFDKANPRTATREIPGGIIPAKNALFFVIANCILFIATTYFINPLCFALSPVALIVILGYSYTKRFTALCHFVLGAGLALAPVGAYLAVTGSFSLVPVILGFVVLTWVGGFDIIYALQDEEFDRSQQLRSVPVALGKKGALMLSSIFHVISGALVLACGFILDAGFSYWIGALIFIGMLIYQHRLVKPDDLSKVNMAFATTNGIASIAFSICVLTDILLF